jgi:hypothetical protein
VTEQLAANVTNIVAAVLPSVISLIKSAFTAGNPGVPPPTSDEVKQIFADSCTSTLGIDDDWDKTHPKG